MGEAIKLGGGRAKGKFAWTRNVPIYKYQSESMSARTTIYENAEQRAFTLYISSSFTFDSNTGMFTLSSYTTEELPFGSAKTIEKNLYITIDSPSSPIMIMSSGASSSANSMRIGNVSGYGLYVVSGDPNWEYAIYTSIAFAEGSPIEYVTSYDRYKYPDDGLHKDGYYYISCSGLLINGVPYRKNLLLDTEVKFTEYTDKVTFPYAFESGQVLKFRGKIHFIGSANSTYRSRFYTFDGEKFTQLTDLPRPLIGNRAVVFQNKIHYLGGHYTSSTNYNYREHWTWDGNTWNLLEQELPYDFWYGDALVIVGENGNEELHIFGSEITGNLNKHYKYDGVTWTEVSTLPFSFRTNYYSGAVECAGQIHIMGGSSTLSSTKHYKFVDGAWVSIGTLPAYLYRGLLFSFGDEIFIIKSSSAVYRFKDTAWTQETISTGWSISSYSVITVISGEINQINDTNYFNIGNAFYKEVG